MRTATAAAAAAEARQSRMLYELSALLLTILRPPGDEGPRQVSAAGVASMLLGASMALMFCGSLTFMLGFFLMPWVLGLACVFLFVGFLTNLSSGIGRAVLCWPAACSSFSSSAHKEASTWHIFPKPPFM
ncbi:unnamed protein product [Alopecurus aequalis]